MMLRIVTCVLALAIPFAVGTAAQLDAAPPLELTVDATLSGRVEASNVRVPQGTTLWLAGDVVLESAGDVLITGDVRTLPGFSRDGSSLTLVSKSRIEIEGSIAVGRGLDGTALGEAGGRGGDITLHAPVIVATSEISAGHGGVGGPGARGGDGGNATVHGALLMPAPLSESHLGVRGGPGGDGGAGLRGTAGGDGGDGGKAEAYHIGDAGEDGEDGEDGVLFGEDGTDGGPGGDEVFSGFGADGASDTGPCGQGGDGEDGTSAFGGNGGKGGDGGDASAAGLGGNGGNGGKGGGAIASDAGAGGDSGDCCFLPEVGRDGGAGGDGGLAFGGDGGDGGAGGEGTGGFGGDGGDGGAGGAAAGGDGGTGGIGADGDPGGAAGAAGVIGFAFEGTGGAAGAAGAGLTPGTAGTAGADGTPTDGAAGFPGAGGGDDCPAAAIWTDVGCGNGGVLVGAGPMTAGSGNVISMGAGLPFGPSIMIVSPVLLGAPFAGGWLVPDPGFGPVVTLPALFFDGTQTIPFTMPTMPPVAPAVVLLQWGTALAPGAFVISNGLRVRIP
jgi:hypothetical protein